MYVDGKINKLKDETLIEITIHPATPNQDI
jgi:hypothetical protein